MSGFFGVVRANGGPFDPADLRIHAQRLQSRGPGNVTIWNGSGDGLCFVAVHNSSTNVAEAGPLSLNSLQHMVGDIRLDGRKELGDPLGLGDNELRNTCDGRLLLQTWQRLGPDCLPTILGDYSFALWDESENALWCARDFLGARPFFYTIADGVFYFSNTLRVLRGLPGVSSELDPAFIGDFLLAGYCDDLSRTAYRDIHRLPPAHYLKYERGRVEVQRFQVLPVEEPLHLKHSEEYLDAYLELLRRAVADRLPQSPAALYLSGGLDSAAVCATASELGQKHARPDGFRAFTVSWQALFDDPEPRFATITAKHLGLAHEIIADTDVLPSKPAFSTPEPWNELFGGRVQRQSALIAKHAEVVLSGDGGDDVLTGQSWPYLRYLADRKEWAQIARDFGGFLISHGRFPPLRGGFRSRFGRFLGRGNNARPFPDWICPEFERKASLRERFEELNRPKPDRHPVHPRAYSGLQDGHWAGLLETEDAGWTGVALETRTPLLDLRLLRFLLRLPPVPWCVQKEIMRKALQSHLPEPILQRAKTTLVRDPLDEVQEVRGWNPRVPGNPSERVQSFVNWSSWHETLNPAKGLISWDNLHPLALEYWLKDIENE